MFTDSTGHTQVERTARPVKPILFSVRDAAELCACSVGTLMSHVSAGRLRAVRIDRRPRFLRADLIAWAKVHRTTAAGQAVEESEMVR